MPKLGSKNVETAAKRFVNELRPGVDMECPSERTKSIYNLVHSAFLLYDRDRKIFGGDILYWQWPFEELRLGRQFSGDEPWEVLLRHAVKVQNRRSREILQGRG